MHEKTPSTEKTKEKHMITLVLYTHILRGRALHQSKEVNMIHRP